MREDLTICAFNLGCFKREQTSTFPQQNVTSKFHDVSRCLHVTFANRFVFWDVFFKRICSLFLLIQQYSNKVQPIPSSIFSSHLRQSDKFVVQLISGFNIRTVYHFFLGSCRYEKRSFGPLRKMRLFPLPKLSIPAHWWMTKAIPKEFPELYCTGLAYVHWVSEWTTMHFLSPGNR